MDNTHHNLIASRNVIATLRLPLSGKGRSI
jgi:hypothetical protein